MFNKIAAKLARRMEEENLIKREQEDYYIYALIIQGEQLVTIGTILLISLLFKQFLPTVLFLLYFLSLRKRTGGFHFYSFIWCYIGTIATYIALIYLNRILIKHSSVLILLLMVSMGIIGMIGTVNHPNMHMNMEELAGSKKAERITVLSEGIIIYFLYLVDVDIACIGSMSIAVILCAILLCLAKLVKQEVKENEEDQQSGIESH